ncbi:sulfatase family protein [Amycolatopsis sp. CA-230715]|uniref:sulfatase family protein n=1 Tax=Amycolatopsis sp. CA-230715 TaxID=2745196 RepID=UPI001C3411A9|nr:sulfatase [Amycolatopsis sp. CA-230715]QWF76642.1 hypothetical protein HUW46_00018 [Amycolatopsis sp. CA-230715]
MPFNGMSSPRTRRVRGLPVLAVAAALLAAACGAPGPAAPPAAGPVGNPGDRPNIVYVLTDDLATNLLPYLPHVQALAKAGASFGNYTVTDSLCCPSRSSILSGKFPHDTGVFTNSGSDGGFTAFHDKGGEKDTVATSLQQAGYRTAMMGKYLNGYQPGMKLDGQENYVPPGWNEWDVAGNGYPQYDYDLNENHKVVHYGSKPQDYLNSVLTGKATGFINSSAQARAPFFLELASFTPHSPYTPAPQDTDLFPGLKAPRTPAYDKVPANAPPWLAAQPPLSENEQQRIDESFRKRAQAVQSVDRMIGALQDTLTKAGVADHTYLVFTSDNGYHMGEYRLGPGKQTAFDTDVRVPLIAAGPGIPAGRTVAEPAENIDLRPTFAELAAAGTPSDVDGRSLAPLLRGQPAPDWRTAALVEHHGPNTAPDDPDRQGKKNGNPPTYNALRTAAYTYVEYVDGGKEYYDRRTDPDQLDNRVGRLPAETLAKLHDALRAMTECHGRDACWAASHAAP